MSMPLMTCAAYTLLFNSDCQSANTFLKTTTPVLPLQVTDLTSSQPVRLATLFPGLMYICHVVRQSAHMTGLPSLQFALGLNVNWVVRGLFLRSLGAAEKSRLTQTALLSRI